MINFIKKHRLSLAVTGLIVLIGINIYLFVDSGALSEAKEKLDKENRQLTAQIKQSQAVEKKLNKKIKTKKEKIRHLDKRLTESLKHYRTLKIKLDTRPNPKPVNPASFKKLSNCREMYKKLSQDFQLCLQTNKENQITLDLCLDKTNEQQAVIDFQAKAYRQCREQGNLKDRKIRNTEKALKTLDRYYKRRMLKRGITKYVIGIAAGVLVGYFVFGKR